MSEEGLLKPSLIAAVATCLVAGAGAALTDLGPWYRQLVQPAWKPPDWAFGPIWTLIFTLAAVAGVMGWRAAPDESSRHWLLALFALNGLLNMLWSALYFRLQRPDWALVEVVALWLSVLALIVVLAPYSSLSSWLLAPYLIWVAIAAALNLATVRLNPRKR